MKKKVEFFGKAQSLLRFTSFDAFSFKLVGPVLSRFDLEYLQRSISAHFHQSLDLGASAEDPPLSASVGLRKIGW